MFSFVKLRRSFKFAFQGLRFLWVSEQSFRVQTTIAILVTAALFFAPLGLDLKLFVVVAIFLVLSAEMINTIVEKFLDVIQPNQDPRVGKIKDMMAAYVLITCGTALVIGVFILAFGF